MESFVDQIMALIMKRWRWCIRLRRGVGRLLALSVLSLVMAGCEEPALQIRDVSGTADWPEPHSATYASPWEALRHLDPGAMDPEDTDPDLAAMAKALESFRDGHLAEAEPPLIHLVRAAGKEEIRQAAVNLLGDLRFYQSRWKDFLEYADRYTGEVADDVPLARAYAPTEAEEIDLPARRERLFLRSSPLGTPVVPVRVNGVAQWFWLDTGAGLTVLAAETARRCGVEPLEGTPAPVSTATRHKITARAARVEDLQIGTARFRHHPVIIVDDADLTLRWGKRPAGVRIRGIVGWKAIRHLDLDVDLAGGELWLRPTEPRSEPTRNLAWIGYPVVRVWSKAGTRLNFGLDTGALQSSLTDTGLNRLGVTTSRTTRRRIVSAGGSEIITGRILSGVTLFTSGYELSFRQLTARPDTGAAAFIQLDGILGSDLLRASRVRLDAGNGRLDIISRHPEGKPSSPVVTAAAEPKGSRGSSIPQEMSGER